MKTVDRINKILDENNVKTKIDKNNLNKNIKELGIDSIVVMSIIVKIEEELGITLDDDKLMSIQTVQDLINVIDEQKK